MSASLLCLYNPDVSNLLLALATGLNNIINQLVSIYSIHLGRVYLNVCKNLFLHKPNTYSLVGLHSVLPSLLESCLLVYTSSLIFISSNLVGFIRAT